MPHVTTINASKHEINIDMDTGDYSVRGRTRAIVGRPSYNPDSIGFNTRRLLLDAFRLTGESPDVINHLFECAGAKLIGVDIGHILLHGPANDASQARSCLQFAGVDDLSWLMTDSEYNPSSRRHVRLRGVIPVYALPPTADLRVTNAVIFEREYVFRKIISGASSYVRRGHLSVPQSCKKAHNEYLRSIDPVESFVSDCAVLLPESNVSTPLFKIYSAYVDYHSGVVNLSQGQLAVQLREHGVTPEYNSHRKKMLLQGIALRI